MTPQLNKRVCVSLTTRGNYGKMKSTMTALAKSPDIDLQIAIGGALVLDSYGDFGPAIEADGFSVDRQVPYIEIGETLDAMTNSAGNCVSAMGAVFAELKPDIVVIVADRYEALSIAQAALCQTIPIAHIEGGEASGSIDDRIRHAVTLLADIHFPANRAAADVLRGFGIPDGAIYTVGTPSLDLIIAGSKADCWAAQQHLNAAGRGAEVNLSDDFLIVSQHPVVTEYSDAGRQFRETARAVRQIGIPTVWVLPNLDAGAFEASRAVEALTNDGEAPPVCVVASLPLLPYAAMLRETRCLVGNTSSGIRESAFLGTPVVNIGTRQRGRLRGANVIDVDYDCDAITAATRHQIDHDRYEPDDLYGDGRSGERIAAAIAAYVGARTDTHTKSDLQ